MPAALELSFIARRSYSVVALLLFLLHPIDGYCTSWKQKHQQSLRERRATETAAYSKTDDGDVPQPARRLFLASPFILLPSNPFIVNAAYSSAMIERKESLDPRAIVTVQLESANDSLGVELGDTMLRGQSVVFVKNIIKSTKKNKYLQPGMILLDYDTAKDVVAALQQWQRSDNPSSSLELKFYNLAAGGDAFNDMGETMVTAQDALTLAKQTDKSGGGVVSFRDGGGATNVGSQQQTQQQPESYRTETMKTADGTCGIRTRRGDVLEIVYDAYYYTNDATKPVLYDSSSFRGTGRPYQMVLGSGDMLAGVDLGVADMCPGEIRTLTLPPSLAYGSRGNKLYKIPPNATLKWRIELTSIDATITEGNNSQTRAERDESRSLYY